MGNATEAARVEIGERLLDARDLADRLKGLLGRRQIHRTQIDRWVTKGMPSVQPGGPHTARYFSWPEVRAWFLEGRR